MSKLNVVVPLEGRFVMRDGRPAAHVLTYERMWKRYLEVFDGVTVVGRLFDQEAPDAAPVEGPGVRFFPLPGYTGPEEYLLRRRELGRRVKAVCSSDSAFILRVPGAIGGLVWQRLRARALPFAVEVVGDPYDVFAPGGVRHPLRPFFRYWMTRQLRRQCQEASAAAYVTESVLQRRYPCPHHMASYSSVELPGESFVARAREFVAHGRRARLVTVGDVNQLYKGAHLLIDAVALCLRDGWDLTLTIVGDGSYLPWLRARASAQGIAPRVEFTGRLPGPGTVQTELDRADLFVLPSYTEGLPRAMIEAMARGLPCVGTSVGGIVELLPAEDLVPPGDAVRLARMIADVLGSPSRLSTMAERNLGRARHYRSSVLQARRMAFYAAVRERTEQELRRVREGARTPISRRGPHGRDRLAERIIS